MSEAITLDELMKKVDSRYTLVSLTAKRARQINQERDDLKKSQHGLYNEEIDNEKPVTVAMEEIVNDDITYIRNSDNRIK